MVGQCSSHVAVLLICLASVAAPAFADEANHSRLKVSMFSGAAEYQSDESLPKLKDYLEKRFDATCIVNDVKDIHDLPGVDQLDSCDVIVIFTRRVELPPEQLAKVKRYMDAGKPVVGIRTASHAFQTWLAFDKEVLGGDYHNHVKDDKPAQIALAGNAKDHPVLAGIEPFTTNGKLYKNPQIAKDDTVLLRATTDETTEPVAWVRVRPDHHDQRVFYTSLGVPADFENENFRRLLANAIFWTAGRTSVEIKLAPEPRLPAQPSAAR
jgi:type 1 glutamine amidotransferase